MASRKLRVLLYETPQDPYYNLAFEEAFARARAAGVIEDDSLRIWRNANAVVIGYFQRAQDEVMVEEARKLGVGIVRRFTGGGAVYHDLGNYNYALAVKPEKSPRNPIDYVYGYLLQGTIAALRKLGAAPALENVNDIVVSGRKVSGTAATLRWGIVFLHGALLVSTNLDILSRVLRVPQEKLADKKVSSVKYRVVTLEEALGRRISAKEVIESLVEGFEEALGYEAYFDMPTRLELKIADILLQRYRDHGWNFERKPITAYSYVEQEVARIIEEEA